MINIDEMSKSSSKRLIYKELWENTPTEKSDLIIRTSYIYRGKNTISKASYSFDVDNLNSFTIAEGLIDVFDITNKDLFHKKFEAACKGFESSRITRIHSSALCALLFFYNITKENPLVLSINGCKMEFYESIYEYKNNVFNEPSNIDLVLYGIDLHDNKNVILFMESKFTEYYCNAAKKSSKISSRYLDNATISKPIYNRLFLENVYEKVTVGNKFSLLSTKRTYSEGIKQMISHYVGIRNLLTEKYCSRNGIELNDKIKNLLFSKNGVKVYLGEILFDHIIGRLELYPKTTCYDDYYYKYRETAKIINDDILKNNISNFEMIPEVLKYSLFRNSSHIVEPKILEFYRINY